MRNKCNFFDARSEKTKVKQIFLLQRSSRKAWMRDPGVWLTFQWRHHWRDWVVREQVLLNGWPLKSCQRSETETNRCSDETKTLRRRLKLKINEICDRWKSRLVNKRRNLWITFSLCTQRPRVTLRYNTKQVSTNTGPRSAAWFLK